MGYFNDGFDEIVIGASVMGSSTAYQLAKRGQKTLLLGQFDFTHHRGPSHGESRTIRAVYPEHYYYGLVNESYQMWKQAQIKVGFRVYFKTQQFDVGPVDAKSLRTIITTCQNVGYWRIKEVHDAKYSIGSDFPTFTSYRKPNTHGTPSLELPRLIKIAEHGGYAFDANKRPWGLGVTPTSLKLWIEERFRGMVYLNGSVLTQLCVHSMTPDEDFVIDFLGGEFGKDVAVGGGSSDHGFKMSPAIGRILTDVVLTGKARGVKLMHFRKQDLRRIPGGTLRT
ncbi:hypothetical protein DITRI_Ditri03aG0006800 [Diplodiscus trichospermus]